MHAIYVAEEFVRHVCGHGETVRLEGDHKYHLWRKDYHEARPCADCAARAQVGQDHDEALPVSGVLAAQLGWRRLLGTHNILASGTRKRDDIIFKLGNYARLGRWEAEAANIALEAINLTCGSDAGSWMTLAARDADEIIETAAAFGADHHDALRAVRTIIAVQALVTEAVQEGSLTAEDSTELGPLIAYTERRKRRYPKDSFEAVWLDMSLVRLRLWHQEVLAAESRFARWKASCRTRTPWSASASQAASR